MSIDNTTRDRQSQAGTAHGPAARLFTPVKLLEYAGQIVFGEAWAIILDNDTRPFGGPVDINADAATGRCVIQRITQ